MWHYINDVDMISWCLEHGASMHPDHNCPPILEKVAAWGTVEMFEFLRSKGAPLGWRSLHLAVEHATFYARKADEKERKDPMVRKLENLEEHKKRMAMVRHLLNTVGLDVNGPDGPPNLRKPWLKGTPICYIPGSAVCDTDTRELTWLLLDRDADPTPALTTFNVSYCRDFEQNVEEWKAQRDRGGSKCCVM